jgi:hypothetical protein
MLWGEFHPCRKSLRLEQGGKFFLWVLPLEITTIFSNLGNNPKQNPPKMAFKFNIWDMHHQVNELWLPSEEAYEILIWKSKFSHVCYPSLYMHVMWGLLPSLHRNLGKRYATNHPNLTTSTLRPFDLLICWNNNIFLHSRVGSYMQVADENKCWW